MKNDECTSIHQGLFQNKIFCQIDRDAIGRWPLLPPSFPVPISFVRICKIGETIQVLKRPKQKGLPKQPSLVDTQLFIRI